MGLSRGHIYALSILIPVSVGLVCMYMYWTNMLTESDFRESDVVEMSLNGQALDHSGSFDIPSNTKGHKDMGHTDYGGSRHRTIFPSIEKHQTRADLGGIDA